MAKIEISKELINNIANQENKQYIKQINKIVNNLVGESVAKLSEKISYISLKNVILQPANELISGAIIDNSLFVYFLGVNSPQLQLNTQRKTNAWKNFKERLKWVWQNRKTILKKRRRKRKKKKELERMEQFKFDPTKYNIYNLTEDMQYAMANFLTETSLIYLYNNKLEIVGKEDFGANTKIVIYLVCYDDVNFKYFAGRKKGFIDINFDNRIDTLQNKINEVGTNFVKMLKIFNYLFYNANSYNANQIFMESVLCSIPNELFSGQEIYKVFMKIVNYISIKSLKDVKSITDNKTSIFKDIRCQNNGIGFNKMMSTIISK